MTFGSLFAGIGGLDLGLERAGMTCKWQVEIDDYARRVLAKHWPHVRRWDDVRTWPQPDTERVDLICGGFPCQPVSLAGKRKGRDDERWLWDEFCRVIETLRPKFVLAENVPGLLSADDGRLFGGILADLATLGFDAEWDCIPAAAVGAPHRRDRLFIIASLATYAQVDGWGPRWKRRTLGPGSRQENTPAMADVDRQSLAVRQVQDAEGTWTGIRAIIERSDWWDVEPDVVRVAHGIPSRVDRIRGLGNAVVPQVAEWIGKQIMEVNHVDRH